jgi:hypothetical protein
VYYCSYLGTSHDFSLGSAEETKDREEEEKEDFGCMK